MLRQARVAASTLSMIVVSGVMSSGLGARQEAMARHERRLECAALATRQVPGVRITEAVAVAASDTDAVKVAHCRVSGVIDKEIHFVELLPDRWNERFFAGGGGGFVGRVANQAQASVNSGYATVGTDTGHQGAQTDASWALGHRDRLVNYAYLAIHRTAEVAKSVITAYYGLAPRHSYFYGCSNGGRQALMEVQRYPADFDGVVSCAPALGFTRLATAFVRNARVVYPNPNLLREPTVTPDNLKLLESKVLAACDARDGVEDGVIADPRDCAIDLADLPRCPAGQPAAGCFTGTELAAIVRIYAPTTDARGVVYPGQPFGGEAQAEGWPAWITGIGTEQSSSAQGQKPSLQFAFGTEVFRYFVFGRPEWDYSTYDLTRWRRDARAIAAILDADSPDLSAFKARGGKLILAHGWADPAINPLSTIAYYERAEARDKGLRDYVRLFMMPGVLHCVGGPGPDAVDWFAPIAEWVERGNAPERLLARKLGSGGEVLNARPLCPHPLRAVYDGRGATTDAASYVCKTP